MSTPKSPELLEEQKNKTSVKESLTIAKWVFSIFYKLEPRLTKTRIFISVINGLQGIALTYILTRIMDMLIAATQNPEARLADFLPYLGLLLGFNILTTTLNHFDFLSDRTLSLKTNFKIQEALADKLRNLGISNLERPEINNKIFRAKNALGTMGSYLDQCIDIIVYTGVLLVSLILLALYIPIAIPIIIVTTIPIYLYDKKYRSVLWKEYIDNTEKRRLVGENIAQLTNTARLPEIYVNGAYSFLMDKYDHFHTWFADILGTIYKKWSLSKRGADIIKFLGTYTGYLLIFKNLLEGGITVGSMFFQIRLIQYVQDYFQRLTATINNILEATLRVKDVYDIFQAEEDFSDGEVELPRLKEGPEIKLENITFCYPNNDKKVLKNINLHIKAGEKVAIVGENGAGKTTLIKLLCRMYTPTEGNIFINNYNLKELKLDDWFKNLGVLFQEYNKYPQLTARENIQIGRVSLLNKIPKEILDKTAEEATIHSNVTDTINQFPDGWEQLLSEKYKGGLRPSTGQWQKLAIARFFYRDSPVVVFDEPTASIDAVSEYNIFNQIYNFFKKKTVIIISHRFSTVKNADRIIVLRAGVIEEQGTHAELMEIEDGIYKSSFELQRKGYE